VLVVCHHSAIAFGAAGGWYYVVPPPPGSHAPLLLTIFAGINQAFFMSLFFAISGYVTPASYDAKGPAAYLRDRLARLGLPLLVYFFVLNPCVVYLAHRFQGRAPEGLLAFVTHDYLRKCGTGPLWFVLALLIFAGVYAALRILSRRERERTGSRPLPGNAAVLGFVLVIGLVAFAVRMVFPTGWGILGLQLGFFPLYVPMFVFGVFAHGNGWLQDLGRAQADLWFRTALVAIVAMPAILLLGGGLSASADVFSGGLTWQAFLYAVWEPVLCVGISMKLIVSFRERMATQGPLARRMARSAYAAYIVHPVFVVCGTALLATLGPRPLLQFIALCLLAVPTSFAVADALRRAPGLARIL
jgi:surface polysaccharide O-acyltransferase-like enzyme